MAQFKVGDRVRLVTQGYYFSDHIVGRVARVGKYVYVRFPAGSCQGAGWNRSSLKHEPNLMDGNLRAVFG